MNANTKRNVVVSAVLVIMLCVSLISGATFALFTSESSVNVAVKSGNVDVTATASEPKLSSTLSEGNLTETSVSSDGNTVTLNKIVAGDVVKFTITIHNASDVSVKYRTVITKVTDDGLWDGLVVKFDDEKFEGDSAKKSEWTLIAPDSKDVTVNVEVSLPKEATKEYAGKSCSFAYTVEAVQGNADVVSEWDGETIDEPTKDNDNVYHITSAAEFVEYITTLNCSNASKYTSAHAVLDTNVDLGGQVFEVSGESYVFAGIFDGQGHTVSNYTIKRTDSNMYTGLFCVYPDKLESDEATIKNLTVENGTVIGAAQVAAIVPSLYNGALVDNCHAVGCTVIGEKKVGAVTGYVQTNGTVSNCSAKDCVVYASDARADQASVYGYDNGGTFTNNANPENCTVKCGVTVVADGLMLVNGVYEISNANGLVWCHDNFNDSSTTNGKSFKLTADIDMTGVEWTPWCNETQYFNASFDGQNHTISNLTINDTTDASGHATGFIGRLGGGGTDNSGSKTLQNVIFDNAKVTGYHWVGVAVGYNEYGSMQNVTVKNSAVTATCNTTDPNLAPCGDKAGAVVGMIGSSCTGANKNLNAEYCTVTAARDAAKVIGYGYANNDITNVSATSVTVTAQKGICTHSRAGIVSVDALVGNGTKDGLTLN